MTPDEKAEQLRALYNKTFINFPINGGISGIAFSQNEVIWTNSADKETNFVNTIDNQSSSSEVKNFLIGPVIGKNGQPNGVIQFINRIDENGDIAEITQQDVDKFNEMRDLFGMCIENTSQIA